MCTSLSTVCLEVHYAVLHAESWCAGTPSCDARLLKCPLCWQTVQAEEGEASAWFAADAEPGCCCNQLLFACTESDLCLLKFAASHLLSGASHADLNIQRMLAAWIIWGLGGALHAVP